MIKRQIGARPFFTTGHVDQPAVPEKLVHHTVITTVRSIKRRTYLLLHKPQKRISSFCFLQYYSHKQCIWKPHCTNGPGPKNARDCGLSAVLHICGGFVDGFADRFEGSRTAVTMG